MDALEPPGRIRRKAQRIVPSGGATIPANAQSQGSARKSRHSIHRPGSTGYFSFPSIGRMEIWVSSGGSGEGKEGPSRSGGRRRSRRIDPRRNRVAGSSGFGCSPTMTSKRACRAGFSEDWDEHDHVSEVWNGEKEDFADTLTACLREIGIPSHKLCRSRPLAPGGSSRTGSPGKGNCARSRGS